MELFVDADTLVYDAAFAAQTKGDIQPVENALHIIKTHLNNLLDKFDPDNMEVILSPVEKAKNFRYALATYKEYKGNRTSREKPVHYKACREYLLTTWDAEIADGHEADDEVAIKHMAIYTQNPMASCIASIDKDLNNIPGLHYNYRRKETYFVREDEAMVNFYTQLLTGDRADNIPGLKGVGPITAEKLLRELYHEKDIFSEVQYQYMLRHPEDYKKRLLEYGQLLWIKRTRDDVWEFPK